MYGRTSRFIWNLQKTKNAATYVSVTRTDKEYNYIQQLLCSLISALKYRIFSIRTQRLLNLKRISSSRLNIDDVDY